MTRQVKCPYCETSLSKSDAHPYKKRYYHVECFNEWRQEADHRNELIEYICQLYNIDAPTGMMLKQIKEYREEFNYKYKGMELALRYFHETLGNNVQEGAGIGIITYVYEDAKKDYILDMKIQQKVDEMETDFTKKKKVVIKSQQLDFKSKVQKFDISSL